MVQIYATVVSYVASLKEANEEGQGMVEYALIIALVGVLLVAALGLLRGGIESTFNDAIAVL